jgi:hypothetical protein
LMEWMQIISPLGIMILQKIMGRRRTPPVGVSPPIFSII